TAWWGFAREVTLWVLNRFPCRVRCSSEADIMNDDFPVPNNWPFADPPETEVITLERIVRLHSSVLLVTHDEDDDESSWQFLDGEQVFEDDGVTILLGEMVQFEPRIVELADLP